MTDWETRYYEAEALHTEANGMLTAERDRMRKERDLAKAQLENGPNSVGFGLVMQVVEAEEQRDALRAYAEEVKRFADGMADAAGLYTLEGCIAAYRKFLAEHGRTTNAMAGAHILAEAERHETCTKVELGPHDNPWRESLINCTTGDNYLREGEYHDLVEYIDDLLIENATLKALRDPVAQRANGALGLPAGHVMVPETPTTAMLRPFYECPPEELGLAWQAMVVIARKIVKDELRHQSNSNMPKGWKLVPVEPTRDMLYALGNLRKLGQWAWQNGEAWAAMLEAAPMPPCGDCGGSRVVPSGDPEFPMKECVHQVCQWIPVTERMPLTPYEGESHTESDRLLVMDGYGVARIATAIQYRRSGEYSWCLGGYPGADMTVTHWMPIPDFEFVAGKKP